jgi:glycosyltransferase involved in cell wall biosynthesis
LKIAFALPFLQRGFGLEHRTIKLATLLPPEIERALLCLVRDVPEPPGVRVLTGAGDGRGARSLAAAAFESERAFRLLQTRFRECTGPDWIVDAQFHPMTSLKPRGPFVVSWYSVPPLEWARDGREARSWVRQRRLMLEGARRADLVLCISRAVEEEIQRELGPKVRTRVVYIGFDEGRCGIELGRELRRVICVGRFAPHKCHEDVLQAFALARRALAGRQLELILVGTTAPGAPYLTSLRSFAAALGLREGIDVHFVSNASDRTIAMLLGGADVFVSASRWEGFGMPLVEAQASGLPAVAYALWSHPEVVASAQCLVREGDVRAMSERIVTLLQDGTVWQKASDEARQFARSRFCWEDIVASYLDCMRTL